MKLSSHESFTGNNPHLELHSEAHYNQRNSQTNSVASIK